MSIYYTCPPTHPTGVFGNEGPDCRRGLFGTGGGAIGRGLGGAYCEGAYCEGAYCDSLS